MKACIEKAWIDEDRIRFEDIDSNEESDGEPMSEEEYRALPKCVWCDDARCPGASAHYEAG